MNGIEVSLEQISDRVARIFTKRFQPTDDRFRVKYIIASDIPVCSLAIVEGVGSSVFGGAGSVWRIYMGEWTASGCGKSSDGSFNETDGISQRNAAAEATSDNRQRLIRR